MLIDTPSIVQDQPLLFSVRRPYEQTRGGPVITIQVDIPAILAMLQDQTKVPHLVDITAKIKKMFLHADIYFENIHWSVRYEGKSEQHTGCIWVEVRGDNAPLLQTLRRRISTDPHTFVVCTNLTGDGFNLVVRTTLTDSQQHTHYGNAWLQYLHQVYQCHTLPLQLTFRPASTWCPLGMDPHPYVNPDSRLFSLTPTTAIASQDGLAGTIGDELTTAYTHLLASAQVRLADPLAPPLACLLLQNEGQPIILGTPSRLGVILEQAHRSPSLLEPIVASAFSPDNGFQGLLARCPPGKPTILLVDTRRSPYQLQQFSLRLARLTGQPELAQLTLYALNAYSPSLRASLVKLALHQPNTPGLVIIERIEDLLEEEADEPAISQLVAQLGRWAEQLGFYLLVVHRPPQDKGDQSGSPAGTWRAQLEAHAETVLEVRPTIGEQDAYEVKAQAPEDPLGSVVFSIPSSGALRLVDAAPSRRASQGESTRVEPPGESGSQAVIALLDRAFAHQSRLQYGQLRTSLLEAAQSEGVRLGKTGAEQLIRSIVKAGYLLKRRSWPARYPLYERNAELPLQAIRI